MISFVLAFFLALSPTHDFHTSWMNMTYDEKDKEFNITWRTDTEHLEGVLTLFSEKEIHLENATIADHKELIYKYIKANTTLKLNGHQQDLQVDLIEVTFAEIIIHFKPIKCRRKLKTVGMQNTLLLQSFPNQKNMVQVNYKGKMYSMLLGASKLFEEILLE